MQDRPGLEWSRVWWRQALFWALGLHVLWLPPAIAAFAYLGKETAALGSALGLLLGAALTAAGIRQWGKIRGAEQ